MIGNLAQLKFHQMATDSYSHAFPMEMASIKEYLMKQFPGIFKVNTQRNKKLTLNFKY
jgi:hypothetical protein